MEAADVASWLAKRLEGVEVMEANGDMFFVADSAPADQRMPFATIVTSDFNDTASNLNRPGVWRLNIGVSRESYIERFGPPPPGPITAEPVDTGHDYTALDEVMPHPIYASLHWASVLAPSAETFAAMEPLLAEAHSIALGRRERREQRNARY